MNSINKETLNETLNEKSNTINIFKDNESANSYNNCDVNNTTNNNHNNNINIIFDKKTPIPFDDDWDISKINNHERRGLMTSQFMYTELLQEILKNDINLNVIIDKEKESGMVYKNNIDQYIQMKMKDIVDKTMSKLNIHLNDINKNDKTTFHEIITFSRQMMNKKYIDYDKVDEIKDGVTQCISNIYDSKKEDALSIAKKIKNIPKTGY